MNTNVIFRYLKWKQRQKNKTLSSFKSCHKIIYMKRFLNDKRNIVVIRNITSHNKRRFLNMS